ncbi:MAG: DMT family transporter [Woeseiaceae bacterium]
MASGWLPLIVASLFEIAMAVALKAAAGWTRLWPSVLGIAAAAASFFFLTFALRQLPLGVAYSVWTGIGTAGVAVVGIAWFGESASVARLTFIGLIAVGTVGLQLTDIGAA